MKEEFYQDKNITKHCAELEYWNEELKIFIHKYNNYRPHQSLDFKILKEDFKIIMKKEEISPKDGRLNILKK